MKLICVGRNYAAHIEELENERPESPVLFIKPDSAILPGEQDFFIPDFSSEIHHEIELLVKIRKVGKHIDPMFAPAYYDEITVGIDFTARDLQQELKSKGLPWEKATIKPNVDMLGMEPTRALALEMETMGKEQANLDGIRERFTRLKRDVTQVIAELRNDFAG